MNVAIIGAGSVGGTLGRSFAGAGHGVTFGVRDPAKGVKGGAPDGARVTSIPDAGSLSKSRELEHLAFLWISLASGGLGRNIAFTLARR